MSDGTAAVDKGARSRQRNRLNVKIIESAIAAAVKSGERSELNDGGGLVLRCPPSGVAK